MENALPSLIDGLSAQQLGQNTTDRPNVNVSSLTMNQ